MERYLNVTEARRALLGLVDEISGGDRVVITKHGHPRAVLVDAERYALLEDVAWVMSDPARRQAMERARDEMREGDVVRPPRSASPDSAALRAAIASSKKRTKR